MGQEFLRGLLITAIGMGLVFAVIIFLWGVMALMMRLTSREKKALSVDGRVPVTPEAPAPIGDYRDKRHQAAAAAVAVALGLARQKTRAIMSDEHQAAINPWQAAHRMRQIENKKR